MSALVRFLPVLLLALIVGAMVWRLANPPDPTVQSALVGKPVPQFQAAEALPGKLPLSSADLADGRPKLFNIFASWCLPCIAEAPLLEELERQGVPIVAIAVRDRPEDIARFLDRHGDPFERIGADPQSAIQLAFGSSGVPETFVVDGNGIIRKQLIGAIERHHVPQLVRAVEEAR
jgi:cytochrome c biogenesis protein CcmG, thiol:disulfide interchange protein DsbE